MRSKDIILNYFKKHGLRYLAGVIFVVASTVLATALPRLLGNAIDIIDDAKSQQALSESLPRVLILMVCCAAGTFIAKFIWRYLIFGFTRSIELYLRHALFSHLQKLSADYYVKNNTGDLITKSIVDAQAVRMMLGNGLTGIVDVLTINAVTIGYMITTTKLGLTLIAVIPLPFLLYLLIKLRKLMRIKFAEVQRSISDIAEKVQENITGIRVIKAFAQEKSENAHFNRLSRAKWKAEIELVKVWAFINPVSSLVFGIIFSLFLYFGGKMVINGQITLGEFVTFNTYIAYLLNPISRISRIIQIWQRGLVSMQRMDTILTAKPTITDESADMSITSLDPIDIRIVNLTFRYPGTDTDVLKSISFHLEPGGVLAVMGATGSGKSTLLSLLMRMWEPPVGTIKISGHEPASIPLNVLRGSIAYVPQETFLFSDTIMSNITFYDERVTQEDAVNAAKTAAVHDSIMEFEKNYDTVVGERGMTLSGGQKQRISIARVFLKNPPVLILDEATSALDTVTELEIQDALMELSKDRTTLIIAHRLSTIRHADEIVVLTEGRIRERGTHEQLVTGSGVYAKLYAGQLDEVS